MNKIKRRKMFRGIWLGIAAVIIAFVVLCTYLVWVIFVGGPAKRSDDIKDYQEIFDLHLYSGLLIFPEEIPENVVETEFFYNYRNTIFDPTYQIFLRCVYDEETYEQEKERLENTKRIYGDREAWPIHEEPGNYPYQAYISVEQYQSTYEYALLSGENEITYIATLVWDDSGLHFDKKYLPRDFMDNEVGQGDKGYSIYEVIYNGNYAGVDNEYVEVVIAEEKYTQKVEEGYFVVTTIHYVGGEEERINSCYFVYGENPDDESAEQIEYQTGKGMLFRDFLPGEDGKSAVLICANGEGKKEVVLEAPQVDSKE